MEIIFGNNSAWFFFDYFSHYDLPSRYLPHALSPHALSHTHAVPKKSTEKNLLLLNILYKEERGKV